MSYGFGYLNDLSDRVGKWAVTVFTKATPQSICEHLRREVIELTEHPDDVEEAADCMLLLLHLAYRQGWNLEQAIINKHEKNQQRSWGLPDAQGVVEHIPSGAAPQKNYCGDCPDRTGPCACDPAAPQTAASLVEKKTESRHDSATCTDSRHVAPGPQEGCGGEIYRCAHCGNPIEPRRLTPTGWGHVLEEHYEMCGHTAQPCRSRAVPDSTPIEKGEV
jgi:hypothetical protein